ncbi:ABC transporter permease subunit, partial [Neglectibacter timonensis]
MRRVLTSFKRDKWLYVMVAPALLWFLIFCYTPMFGIGIAFRRYQPGMSFFSFDGFVGFKNFQNLFSDHFFWRAFQNSIILAVMRIAVCLPAAVFMAILLSEVKNKVFKSLVQTVTYIPHFLSWVVVSVFCITFFNPETGINFLLKGRGLSPITLTDNNLFRIIVVGADMWKDMGFNSVLFLSAILSIDPGLYESAAIDGAGRGRCIFSITLPCIRNTI